MDQYLLRARLLDMLIGDWDRHDDQWRWVAFEEGKHDFKAIPRDRDQAFCESRRFTKDCLSQNGFCLRYKVLTIKIRDVNTFNFNADMLTGRF